MKILYFLNGSNFTSAGGMEYHLVDITAWMERKGVRTACAVRKGTYLERVLLQDKQNLYPLTWTGPLKFIAFFQMARALLAFAPDIVSVNRERDIKRVYFMVKLMGLFLRRKPKIVAIFQNVGWRDSFRLDKLDGLIFLNEYTKQDYLSWNKEAESKSTIINYGIPMPGIDAAERSRPDRPRRYFKDLGFPLIGMVGEFRKNQSELIDVGFHLKKKHPDFMIVFVGRGSDAETKPLRDKIEKLGLTKNFFFAGAVDRKVIPDVFYDLDLSVTTNRAEAFGLVFIESLASYAPLVAYRSGGPVEILEKGGGVLVDGGPEDMANRIATLISDHRLRTEMGKAARRVAEIHYSIDAMGERHYAFYRCLLDEGKGA